MTELGHISSELSAALALDLAADIWPEAKVFKNHGLEPLHGAALLRQPWFKQMVDTYRSEWNAINNAKQRIKLKSEVAVEMSIDKIYEIVTDKGTPAAARVSAFKELKDISGTAAQDQQGSGGPAVPSVNIFLNGRDAPSVSITPGNIPTIAHDEHPDVVDVTPGYDEIEGMAPL